MAVRASSNGAIKYLWELLGPGTISGTGEAILYTAPFEGDQIAVLTVKAQSLLGYSPPTSLIIHIGPDLSYQRLDAFGNLLVKWVIAEDKDPAQHIHYERSFESCHTNTDCLRFIFSAGAEGGGVRWLPMCYDVISSHEAANPRVCEPIDVLKQGNFSKVSRLLFWARGVTGREIIEFKIPSRSLGRVTLSTTWEQYEIPLDNVDLSEAVGLFIWIATDVDNPDGAIFYLDDMYIEGVK